MTHIDLAKLFLFLISYSLAAAGLLRVFIAFCCPAFLLEAAESARIPKRFEELLDEVLLPTSQLLSAALTLLFAILLAGGVKNFLSLVFRLDAIE